MENTPDIIFPHLGIEIDKLSRVAFNIFGLAVYWYGIIITLGIVLGFAYATYAMKKIGKDPDIIVDFAIPALIFSMIGARLYYVVFSWDNYKDNLLSILNTRQGGLAIYGAVIAATITSFVYTRIKKINFLLFIDCAAPGLILGQAIGRWGNFFNREAFGGYTDSIFAMQYLRNKVEYADLSPDILDNLIIRNGYEYIQVHPTFLYESLWGFALFIILVLYVKHKKFNGEIAALYFIGYGIGRFWIEGLRTDQLIFFGTGLAVSQMLSVLLVLCGLVFIIYKRIELKKYMV